MPPGLSPSSPERLKIAFIGSHGVGKTTLCYGLAARLKARDFPVEVVHEVARRCPLPINEETSLASESWILHTQIAEEILAQHRYPVVVCDRSALDNHVYLLLAAPPPAALDALVDAWMATYDLLIHVPVVAEPFPDGIRAADPAYQRAVDQRLEREIAARGLDSFRLDPDGRAGWLDAVEAAVLERLRPAQLEIPI
ncbi:MAG TPA: ATP-binding protein [Thermoanaerobaculia bacterium]|nr:ATP-binding protein [Thermoanaerobaculia bacterium]